LFKIRRKEAWHVKGNRPPVGTGNRSENHLQKGRNSQNKKKAQKNECCSAKPRRRRLKRFPLRKGKLWGKFHESIKKIKETAKVGKRVGKTGEAAHTREANLSQSDCTEPRAKRFQNQLKPTRMRNHLGKKKKDIRNGSKTGGGKSGGWKHRRGRSEGAGGGAIVLPLGGGGGSGRAQTLPWCTYHHFSSPGYRQH